MDRKEAWAIIQPDMQILFEAADPGPLSQHIADVCTMYEKRIAELEIAVRLAAKFIPCYRCDHEYDGAPCTCGDTNVDRIIARLRHDADSHSDSEKGE